MRNPYLLLLVGIMLFTGCKMKSGSISDSDSKSWSKEYRNNFIQDCIDKASENVSASQAFKDCNCMTEKVEAKYPDETKVDEKISNEDIESMKVECLSQNDKAEQTKNMAGWSVSDQREFMNGCTPTVNKTLGTNGATDYCDCLLKKLMQEYPDPKSVDRASKTHLSALASGCLGR